MAELYPVYLDLEGKPCLVVGGGTVATRKVGGLLRAGARVTVVAPEVTREIEGLAGKGALELCRRAFRPGDVEGRWLVFCATGEPAVNRSVFQACEAARIPANVADDPPHCRFHVPARWAGGKLQIAVSTSGGAPALGARIAREEGKRLASWAPRLVAWIEELRAHLKERIPDDGARRGAFIRSFLEAHGDDLEGFAARDDREGFADLVEAALREKDGER